MAKTRIVDAQLLDALTAAYTARARLFHEGVRASGLDLLIAEIDALSPAALTWELKTLGVTPSAFRRVRDSGAQPHHVFAHPAVVAQRPHLVAYYRNLAAVPHKGIGQLLFATDKYELRRAASMPDQDARRLCALLNRIISGVVECMPDYSVRVSRDAILAEIGAQLQGTWANYVGKRAGKQVQKIIEDHVTAKALGTRALRARCPLKNGWTVVFAAEPDVAFLDPKGVKRIVIEVKGSLDRAGAQTRYGEALKSFRKQLQQNPRCHTIYLASCFTSAVIDQIRTDGQVRAWYNLTSILADPKEREHFLSQLFHIVNAPA
jgi:hypothetical protein